MKKILTFLFSLIVVYTNGQIYVNPNSTFGTQEFRRAILSTFHYPTGCGVPTDSTYLNEPGIKVRQNQAAIYYDSCGHHAYNWDPALRSWALLGSGSGGGVDSIYNRTDSAFYRLNGIEEFAFLIGGDTTNLSHRIDTLSTTVLAALGSKIGNFLGVTYIGYGSHAARPTVGTGLYYDTDSASFFRVNGASYTNLFPSFNVTVLGKGGPGDTTLVSASGGNLLVAAVRDSTGGCIGHVVNPDGSWTLYSTCALKNYWDSVAGKISPHGSTDTVIVNRLVVNNRIDQSYTNATAGAFNQTGFNGTDRNNAIGTTGSTINGIRRAYTPNGSTFNLDIYNAFISDMSSTPSAVINTGTGYSVLLSGSSNWGAQNGVSIINGGGTNRKAYATNLSAGTGNYAFYSSADAVSLFGGAIGINQAAPSASSLLDIISTSKGVLIPRMTNAQMLAITSPSGSLLVFNTDSSSAVTGGYYYYDGLTTTWRPLSKASGGGGGGTSVANSTATIGVTRIVGTATTAKRSDAADPIDTTATGVPAYHNLTDSARVLRQLINANMPDSNVKGNLTGGSAPPANLTTDKLTALIRTFSSATKGAVPASGTADPTLFLNAAGAFSSVQNRVNLFADSNARIGAGTIRATVTGVHGDPILWQWIGAAEGHTKYNFSSYLEATSTGFILYTPTADTNVYFSSANDESLSASGIQSGGSQFQDHVAVSTFYPVQFNGGYLVGTGGSTLTNNMDPGFTLTYTQATGTIVGFSTAVYVRSYASISCAYMGPNNYHMQKLTSGLGGSNQFGFKILDAGGNPVTVLSTSDMIVFSGFSNISFGIVSNNVATGIGEIIYNQASFSPNYWFLEINSNDPRNPDQPTTFTATASGTAGQINLAWAAMPRATNYIVRRSLYSNQNFAAGTQIYSGSGTSFTDTGLTTGTKYYYIIQATATGTAPGGYALQNGWSINTGTYGTVAP